jgi:MFS family permease
MAGSSTAADLSAAPLHAQKSGRSGRKLYHYPERGQRWRQLSLAVLVTIILYYQLYTVGGVSPLLAVQLHMSFMFLVLMIAFGNLIGAFGSLAAGLTDRLGRANIVIWGMLVVGLLTTFLIPAMPDRWTLAVALWITGFIEGMLLVATPALVRDFSPQVGRATAMGLWNVGPVAGSLIVAIVAAATLEHFGNTWTSQFRISGIVGLITFVIALIGMKELAPELRDQLMVKAHDSALAEARAAGGFTANLEHPFRQLFKADVVVPAIGSGTLLLLYFTLVGFGPILYVTAFHMNTSEANAVAAWAWGVNVVVSLFVGILFDWTMVRKPWMIVGGVLTLIFELILLFSLGHQVSFGALALLMGVMSGSFGVAMIGFYAGYTETVEDRNPALVATGLAVWGWIVRIMAFLSFAITPLVVTSANVLLEGQTKSPAFKQALESINGEWKTWLWICVIGTVFFMWTATLHHGPWSIKRAHELRHEHDAKVAAELAKLQHQAA